MYIILSVPLITLPWRSVLNITTVSSKSTWSEEISSKNGFNSLLIHTLLIALDVAESSNAARSTSATLFCPNLEPLFPATFKVLILLSINHLRYCSAVGFTINFLSRALANRSVAILPAEFGSDAKYTVASEFKTFCSVLGK